MAAENVGPAGGEADMNSASDLELAYAWRSAHFDVLLSVFVVAVDAGSGRRIRVLHMSGFSESFLVDGPPNFAKCK